MSMNRGGRRDWTRFWRRVWIAVALFTVYGALLPFDFVASLADLREHIDTARLLAAVPPAHVSLSDVFQNILLYVPFGVFGLLSSRRVGVIGALALTVLLAALLSSTCELLQLLTVDRTTSLIDVVANVFGAVLGGFCIGTALSLSGRVRDRFVLRPDEARHAFLVLCTVSLVCVAAWEPFDVTLDVGTVWSKLKPFVNGPLVTWSPVSDEALTALRFAMLVVVLSEWLPVRRAGAAAARTTAAVIATGLALVLELTQFLITSRSPSVQDVIAALTGVLAGTFVAPFVRRASAESLVVVCTLAAAIPFYLEPFQFAPHHVAFAWFPFLAYYEFTSLQTVSHVTDLALIFAPIGFVAEWCHPRHAMRRTLVITLCLASSLEYAQGWIVGRFPDVTDIAISMLGAAGGVFLASSAETFASDVVTQELSASEVPVRSPRRTSDQATDL